MLGKLSGKVALITGASSGIGAATAILFSKLGANLSLTGRNVENLQSTANACIQAEPGQKKPLLIPADLTNESELASLVQKTIDEFGKLDILVNNAGVLEMGNIENTTMEQYDRVMNVNVRSIYQLTMLATPELIKTKGNIVNISSVNGIRSVSINYLLTLFFVKSHFKFKIFFFVVLYSFQGFWLIMCPRQLWISLQDVLRYIFSLPCYYLFVYFKNSNVCLHFVA